MPRTRLSSGFFCLIGLGNKAIATPFSGPGHRRGAARAFTDGVPLIISVTGLELHHDWAQRRRFWDAIPKIQAEIAEAPGFIGSSLRVALSGKRAWTLTVWKDEASIAAFLRGPAHRRAISIGAPLLKRASAARGALAPDAFPPQWNTALQMLEQTERQIG